MCWTKYWRSLFSFQGWVVVHLNVGQEIAVVRLRRDKRCRLKCPACGRPVGEKRREWQTVKDLPLGPVPFVHIHYEAVQGRCSPCQSYITFRPEGFDGRARATERLKRFVSRACRFLPLSHVPDIAPVSTTTAYHWDKAVLKETLPEPNLDDLRILLVDEKAVRRHYGFVTLVMNGETGELLHFDEGKKKTSLQPFFDRLTPAQKERIEAVAMDRNGAYKRVVDETIPHADVVYDKFHIIANMPKERASCPGKA